MTEPGGAGATSAEQLGRAALALAMNAALGFAIATITRSQLAGIGVGIGLYFAEGIAGIFLPQVFKWFPFSASGAVVARRSPACSDGGGADLERRDARHRARRSWSDRRGWSSAWSIAVALHGAGGDRRLGRRARSVAAGDRRQRALS